MIEFENIIEINRPLEEVFTFISNFENVPKWNYYVLEVKQTSEGPINVGTTYHQVRKSDSQEFRISEYQPHKKVAVHTLPESQPAFEMVFSFEAVANGTRLTDKWKLDTGKPGLIEKIAQIRVKKAVLENLGKLKILMETGTVRLQDGRIIQL